MKYIMYRISVGDYTYIGSTKDFKQRVSVHKYDSNKKDLKVYQMIREAGGFEKCEIVPIEEFECETTLEAHIREEHWRREYNANMNTRRAHRTEEERIEQEREQHKIQCKKRDNTKHTCECGKKYTHRNKTRHEKTQKHIKYLEEQNLTPI